MHTYLPFLELAYNFGRKIYDALKPVRGIIANNSNPTLTHEKEKEMLFY